MYSNRNNFQNRQQPQHKISAKLLIIFFALIVFGLVELTLIAWRLEHPGHQKSTTAGFFDKKQYSTNRASSIWAIVNKGRVLPSTYKPSGLRVPNVPLRTDSKDSNMELRSEAASSLEAMFAAAASDGIRLRLASAYRSYTDQTKIYHSEVNGFGQEYADKDSARPGYSEHQTGLAADIEPQNRQCEFDRCFATTPGGQWLVANSYLYGFIIRYQKDKEQLTGYQYEPWHVRYIGKGLAAQINEKNIILEQFFGLPTYPQYIPQPYKLQS